MKKIILLVLLVLMCPIKAVACDIPEKIVEIADEVGEEYGICPELLEAMAYKESRFTEDVVRGNHYGLMQVNVKVHADRLKKLGYTRADMLDAKKNMTVAADYLLELFEEYEDCEVVLAHYSGSIKSFKKYGYCKYARDVLTRSYNYEDEHGKH